MSAGFCLNHLTLHNFYNYFGKVDVDFESNESSKNMFLFIFQNGGGKTSMHHAIKWVLYGKLADYYKRGVEVKPQQMMNVNSDPSEGYSVELIFTFDDCRYTLIRESRSPFITDSIQLSWAGGFLTGREAEEKISSIVPKNYSSFFIFDGTDLTAIASAQNDKDKVANVLKLLGLDKLQLLRTNLDEMDKSIKKEIVGYRGRSESQDFAKKEYETFSAREVECEKAIGSKEDAIRQNESVIQEYKVRLNGIKEIQPDIEEKGKFEIERSKLEGKLTSYKENVEKHRASLPFAILEKDINVAIIDYNSKIEDIDATFPEKVDIRFVSIMKEIVRDAHAECPVCCRTISMDDIQRMKDRIYSLDIGDGDLRVIEKSELKRCVDYLKDSKNKINGEIFDDILSVYTTQKRIEDINKAISNLSKKILINGAEHANEWQGKVNECENKNREYQRDISDLKKQMSTWSIKKDVSAKKIKNAATVDDALKKYIFQEEKCRDLLVIIDAVKDKLFKEKRDEILKLTSEYFIEITNKPQAFDHLQYISDNSYSMEIVMKNGKTVPLPSTGEDQVVAMCFLLVLSKCSGRTTPIVMDTPITNLDETHAMGIARRLSFMSNQFIFLAQPMESGEGVYNILRKIVAKEYHVTVDSTNSAQISEVSQ